LGAAGVREPFSFLPVLYPMRHTAALGVATLALAILGLLKGERKLATTAAGAAAVLSIVALGVQIFRWTRPDGSVGGPFARAISALIHTAFPNSLAFFIAATALLVLCGRRESIHRWVWVSIAGAVTMMLGACGFVNEVLHVMPVNPAFEGEVAVDVTLSLTLIGWAMIRVARSRAESMGEEIEFSRPILVAMLGTLAAFLTWRSLLEERSNVIAYQTLTATNGTVRALRSELERRLNEVRYAADESSPTLLRQTAPAGSGEILWTDSNVLRSSDDPELVRLKPLIAHLGQSGAFYDLAPDESHPPKMIFAVPKTNGVSRVAAIPLRDVLEPVISNLVAENFQIFLLRGGKEIYRYPDPPRGSETIGASERAIDELDAVMRLQPRSQYVRRGASWASNMVLAIGLNASFLLAFSAYLLHVARSRLDELQHIRSGLEREVAQRRSAQAELARKAKQLEISNADLREFAHATSHDLQEPLRSITGFAQLLSRRYKGHIDEEADEFLDYISGASSRMAGMIQGLLVYSRVVNAADLDEEVPLNECVDWAQRNLLLAIEESGAQLDIGDLPTVRGNRLQFCQLMQNLIGNAIKYRGPDPPIISVTCETQDSERVITVADNGLGIGPEFQERIFGLFKRAHGKEYPGAGVGLALCKKIVERHGGRIWVESKPGWGARFRFTIPL
jgi:signal transduction histidine kinase